MHESVLVVSVEHERVSAGGRTAGGNDRSSVVNLVLYDLLPFLTAVVTPLPVCHTLVIIEIVEQRVWYDITARPARQRVVHAYRYAAVQHQFSDSVAACFAAVTVVLGRHVVPGIMGRAEISRKSASSHYCRRISVRPLSGLRPAVIVHHLSHSRRHTSRRTLGAYVVVRTHIIIWRA